jgi:hypothetical protein
VGFVLGKVALGQVFSDYFGFPCQFLLHRLLHTHHLSSGAGIIGQLVADVRNGGRLTPPQETKLKKPSGYSVEPKFLDPCLKPLLLNILASSLSETQAVEVYETTKQKDRCLYLQNRVSFSHFFTFPPPLFLHFLSPFSCFKLLCHVSALTLYFYSQRAEIRAQ